MPLDDMNAKHAKPEILADKCKGCTLCVKKCPANAITGERKLPHVIDTEKCIRCGACADACPFDAVAGLPGCEQPTHSLEEPHSIPAEYWIDDHCNGCTICAQNCPESAIPLMPYRRHHIDQSVCSRCGICRLRCPNGAVAVRREQS